MKVKMVGVYKHWDGVSGKIRVLENVSIEFRTGEFTAIMGPSGTGKSSLLHLLGCIDKPNFGQIFLEDTNICEQPEYIREEIRLEHIGFVFQNYYLLPTLSVIENVMLPMQLANSYKNEQQQRAFNLLKLVGMDKKTHELTNRLSGGQMQRVSTARALANNPGLLLADEPTGNLDTKSTREVMDMLRIVNKEQKLTTVIVTHDPKVAAYADRVYYLDEGRITSTNL